MTQAMSRPLFPGHPYREPRLPTFAVQECISSGDLEAVNGNPFRSKLLTGPEFSVQGHLVNAMFSTFWVICPVPDESIHSGRLASPEQHSPPLQRSFLLLSGEIDSWGFPSNRLRANWLLSWALQSCTLGPSCLRLPPLQRKSRRVLFS